MYFSSVQISNYKSYRNSKQLDLSTGINIVIGKNNVGKTALLDALSLQFQANPHRSIETAPRPSTLLSPTSLVTLKFTLARRELLDSLIQVQGEVEFYIALPALDSAVAQELEYRQHSDGTVAKFGEWFFSHEMFTFSLTRESYGEHTHANWYTLDNSYICPHFERARQADTGHYGKFRIDPVARTFTYIGYIPVGGTPNDFVVRVASALIQYIYRFRAERFPSGPGSSGCWLHI